MFPSKSLVCLPQVNQPELLTDEIKFLLITNRIPHVNFIFLSRIYKDKRRQSGVINRCCTIELLNTFDFITECFFFVLDVCYIRTLLTEDRRNSEPCFNWKDAREDLKQHSVCDYHFVF